MDGHQGQFRSSFRSYFDANSATQEWCKMTEKWTLTLKNTKIPIFQNWKKEPSTLEYNARTKPCICPSICKFFFSNTDTIHDGQWWPTARKRVSQLTNAIAFWAASWHCLRPWQNNQLNSTKNAEDMPINRHMKFVKPTVKPEQFSGLNYPFHTHHSLLHFLNYYELWHCD